MRVSTAASTTPAPPRRLLLATAIAVPTFFRHSGSQFAAAISYRVLFSLVPFAALVVSIADLVLPDSRSTKVDEWVHGLSPVLGDSVSRAASQSGAAASATGLVALAGMVWAASGMAASVRAALRVVWGEEAGAPYLRGKLVDLVLVVVAIAFVLATFAANVAVQLVTSFGAEVADDAGLHRADGHVLGALGQTLVSFVFTVAALLVLYRLPAQERRPFRELLAGALVGGLAVQLAIAGFTLYVGTIADFDQIYGALGGIFGFLFLVYLVAATVVVGAEVAAAWPLAGERTAATDAAVPFTRRLGDLARGLVSRS